MKTIDIIFNKIIPVYRDELKKIDEQTGGQKAKESSKKLSYEEKQIQVSGLLPDFIIPFPYK